MTFDEFDVLVRRRRATRHFKPQPLPDGLLPRLLECVSWAPSGYNLQPTRWRVVSESSEKEALHAACMRQDQVLEAPATVVFAGDAQAHRGFQEVLRCQLDGGAINAAYAEKLTKLVPLAFERGPLGVGWLWKATVLPIVRLFAPVPDLPAVRRREWLMRQTMLSAMTFMLAATAAGLHTCPMEGFDQRRVVRALRLPRSLLVTLVVPVGYSRDGDERSTRLPLESYNVNV